jgi:hypothetical protein
MKNKKIEKLRLSQKRNAQRLRSKLPFAGDGVYSFVDFDAKFKCPSMTGYCEFDFFYGGRCYFVVADNIDVAIESAAWDLARTQSDLYGLSRGECDSIAHNYLESTYFRLSVKPHISIKQCKNYVFVNATVNMMFESMIDIYTLRDAVVQYLKHRDMKEFIDATTTIA